MMILHLTVWPAHQTRQIGNGLLYVANDAGTYLWLNTREVLLLPGLPLCTLWPPSRACMWVCGAARSAASHRGQWPTGLAGCLAPDDLKLRGCDLILAGRYRFIVSSVTWLNMMLKLPSIALCDSH